MKAAIGLLADREVSNLVSRTAWELHRAHRLGLDVRRLPPHVSLKQPFDIDAVEELEAYVADFAQSIEPFVITLGDYHLSELPESMPTSSVLSIAVNETTHLRSLHNQLNHELADRFAERHAAFDGDAYRFHLTIAAGTGTVQAYREAYANRTRTPLATRQFETRELALFLYDSDDGRGPWQYFTYRILLLGPTPA